MFVPQSLLTITGGSKVRLTLMAGVPFAGGERALTIGECFLGQAAAVVTAAAPSYASTPNQVFFGGNPNCVIPISSTLVTDDINIGLPTVNGLILGFSLTDTSGSTIRYAAQAASLFTNKAGTQTDAATVIASGYSVFIGGGNLGTVTKIEVFK